MRARFFPGSKWSFGGLGSSAHFLYSSLSLDLSGLGDESVRAGVALAEELGAGVRAQRVHSMARQRL